MLESFPPVVRSAGNPDDPTNATDSLTVVLLSTADALKSQSLVESTTVSALLLVALLRLVCGERVTGLL